MDRNQIAVLTNKLGGYDEAEKITGVDAELLQRAVEGEILDYDETTAIEAGIGRLWKHPNLATDNNIDTETLFGSHPDFNKGLTGNLDLAIGSLYDVEGGNVFREKVAEGLIDLNDLRLYYGLFNNLAEGYNQRGRIIEYLQSDDGDGLRAMLDGYVADNGNIWKDDSEFWEWYRETFYGND